MYARSAAILLRRQSFFPCIRRISLSTTTDTTTTSLRLYRILLRLCKGLDDTFLIQQPLNPRDYGHARHYHCHKPESSTNPTPLDILKLFFTWQQNVKDNPIAMTWFTSVSEYTEWHVDQDYNDEYDEEYGACMWTSPQHVKDAIRLAFSKSPDIVPAVGLQRLAIEAIQVLQQQQAMQRRSSVSLERGIRIVATSSCIGTSMGSDTKYRFAYRIRVEHVGTTSDDDDDEEAVQLLGREWHIQDQAPDGTPVGEPQTVRQLTKGAVGHLPVLEKGDVFEYMSGCELFTKTGVMYGSFHMAKVPNNTPSAMVGDSVDALQNNSVETFDVTVKPFLLVAE